MKKNQWFLIGGPLDGQVRDVDADRLYIDHLENQPSCAPWDPVNPFQPFSVHRYQLMPFGKGGKEWTCGLHNTLSLAELNISELVSRIEAANVKPATSAY